MVILKTATFKEGVKLAGWVKKALLIVIYVYYIQRQQL